MVRFVLGELDTGALSAFVIIVQLWLTLGAIWSSSELKGRSCLFANWLVALSSSSLLCWETSFLPGSGKIGRTSACR